MKLHHYIVRDSAGNLRTKVAPVAPPPPFPRHAHRCAACRKQWSHDPREMSERAHIRAHKCPRCGTRQTYIAGGWPAVVRNWKREGTPVPAWAARETRRAERRAKDRKAA